LKERYSGLSQDLLEPLHNDNKQILGCVHPGAGRGSYSHYQGEKSMKIKKGAVIDIVNSFDAILKSSKSPRLSYMATKNKRALQAEYDAVLEARKQLFDVGQNICKEFANKDDNGNPIKVKSKLGEQWDIPQDAFGAFSTVLEERQGPVKDDLEKILEEEIEITEHKIDMSLIENDEVAGVCIEAIFDFIKE